MIFGISHSQTFSDDGALLGARTGKGNKSMLDPSHFGTTSTIDVDCLCIEDFRRLGSRREQCQYIGFDRLPTRSVELYQIVGNPHHDGWCCGNLARSLPDGLPHCQWR